MFPFDIKNLGASFKRYFQIVPAVSEELREVAFRIRHRVYCEDLGYEPIRVDGRECDRYDEHSLHCLIRSVKSGDYVACTRLVLCRPDAPMEPLPFERTCAAALDASVVDPRALPRHRIAEVSRLAVISQFRMRRHEQRSALPLDEHSFGDAQQPRFPYIPVALYLATTELAKLHGIETMFVLTEPRLAQHFARLGVRIRQIGAPVEHRGTRIPSMLSVPGILGGLNFIMRPLYEEVAAEVQRGIAQERLASFSSN